MIFKADKVYEIMKQINDIEGKNQHFELLLQMDFLVPDNLMVDFESICFNQNKWEQRHA